MKPFNKIRNIDGCSNTYTQRLYTYDDTPTCSQSKPDCGSPYIFCDTTQFGSIYSMFRCECIRADIDACRR